MATNRSVYLPAQLALHTGLLGNPVRQLGKPAFEGEVEVTQYLKRGVPGELVNSAPSPVLIVPRNITRPDDHDVLVTLTGKAPNSETECLSSARNARWLHPRPATHVGAAKDASDRCDVARQSWQNQFSFREERYEAGQRVQFGLRPPQLGALYAALAHWKVTNEPATIVMPTGTGKTETMLALLTKELLPRLLVIVPTDPLREQIARKFLTLGYIKLSAVLGAETLYPVVGTLRKTLKSVDDVEGFFRCCNVVVTTMAVLSGCHDNIQTAIAAECSHLFIDEAHHVTARSWFGFRKIFGQKPILQFTATPFRGDGKHVDGKVIFNYPLRKAQAEGYFRPITFRAITAYDQLTSDHKIARLAIQQLEDDLSLGHDHRVMARVKSIPRAEAVVTIYKTLAAAHRPLLIHSRLTTVDKQAALSQLRSGQTKIIVCVDMLGEGFDLPELKIAALHDMHKSLAITLQFTGRFTRTKPTLGNATVIANAADADVEEALRALYAEDADWNVILRQLSEGATGHQVRNAEFLANFQTANPDVPLQNIFPAMSTVVYRTTCKDWHPHRYESAFRPHMLPKEPSTNHKDRVLLFVTRELEPVPWAQLKDIQNILWHLYLVHWDQSTNLLYIHSSNNSGLHTELAKAIAGSDASIIDGQLAFRSFHGMKRILLLNLGLTHSLSRAVRFTMFVGHDIAAGLSEAQFKNKIKSNTFGRGYEAGKPVSIGCSRKGRVWAYRTANDLPDWIEWCHTMGAKLTDSTVSWNDDILPHVLKPQRIEVRPALVPLAIEWSEFFLLANEETVIVEIGGRKVPFLDVCLDVTAHAETGPLRFRVSIDSASAEYELVFIGAGDSASVEYRAVSQLAATITVGKKSRSLSEWFQEEPPVMRFVDNVFLIHNELFRVSIDDRVPFDHGRIEEWPWTGVDLKVESQTPTRLTNSIQYHLIQELLTPGHDPEYTIVFDDDNANEAADVVAMALEGNKLLLHLFHCKFSGDDKAGARVDDMYAVCGQAQRSVFWKDDLERLLKHLEHREARQLSKYSVSRFQKGLMPDLRSLQKRAPFLDCEATVFVVQPGLSKQKVAGNTGILDLLATTELYLKETHGISLRVIASP